MICLLPRPLRIRIQFCPRVQIRFLLSFLSQFRCCVHLNSKSHILRTKLITQRRVATCLLVMLNCPSQPAPESSTGRLPTHLVAQTSFEVPMEMTMAGMGSAFQEMPQAFRLTLLSTRRALHMARAYEQRLHCHFLAHPGFRTHIQFPIRQFQRRSSCQSCLHQ